MPNTSSAQISQSSPGKDGSCSQQESHHSASSQDVGRFHTSEHESSQRHTTGSPPFVNSALFPSLIPTLYSRPDPLANDAVASYPPFYVGSETNNAASSRPLNDLHKAPTTIALTSAPSPWEGGARCLALFAPA